MALRMRTVGLMTVSMLAASTGIGYADIFRYVDPDGTVHFSPNKVVSIIPAKK